MNAITQLPTKLVMFWNVLSRINALFGPSVPSM
jgi:hypothetical protein